MERKECFAGIAPASRLSFHLHPSSSSSTAVTCRIVADGRLRARSFARDRHLRDRRGAVQPQELLRRKTNRDVPSHFSPVVQLDAGQAYGPHPSLAIGNGHWFFLLNVIGGCGSQPELSHHTGGTIRGAGTF